MRISAISYKQGRKRPLDTPKRMIERREREEGERDVRDIENESERERHRALPYRVCVLVENLRETSQTEK